eukprot:SAG31_NODE_5789_length_2328_cov_1.345446_1_plen_150_part_10
MDLCQQRPSSAGGRWQPSKFIIKGQQSEVEIASKRPAARCRPGSAPVRLPARPASALFAVERSRAAACDGVEPATGGASLKGMTDIHGLSYEEVLLARVNDNKLRLSELFRQIDRDGSGTIDIQELRTLLMLIGVDGERHAALCKSDVFT